MCVSKLKEISCFRAVTFLCQICFILSAFLFAVNS